MWHNPENLGPPNSFQYERREKIPEEHRCKSCDGFGTCRWRYSDFGPNEGKDWQECWNCSGSGIKTIDIDF